MQHQQQQPRITWATRVQGRRELMAACSAAKREGAVLMVRLSKATCAPCHRSEPLVRAALDAISSSGIPGGGSQQVRVYWLDADQPGSADVFAFFSSRGLCRGVPALFLWRGSEDLYAPDISHDGSEPYGIVRLLARAVAADSGDMRGLREHGLMHDKAGPDMDLLRRSMDPGVAAVLFACDPFLHAAPPPRESTKPANATEMVRQAALLQQQEQDRQLQPQPYYYAQPPQYAPPQYW